MVVPGIRSAREDSPLTFLQQPSGPRGRTVIGTIADPPRPEPAFLAHAGQRRPNRLLGQPELGSDADQAPDPDLATPVHNVVSEQGEHHGLRADHVLGSHMSLSLVAVRSR